MLQLGLTNALTPGFRGQPCRFYSPLSSKGTARPGTALRGWMGVERGKSRVGGGGWGVTRKSRVLPLAPLDRGGGLQQMYFLRRRPSPLRCFIGLSHSPH